MATPDRPQPARPPGRRQRVLIVSHYYDPEPLPKAGELARALLGRGYDVRVATGLPTYPAGKLAEGYGMALRSFEELEGVPVVRTFEVPYHGKRAIGRVLNYGSTALSLPLAWTWGWAPDAVYVWAPPPTTVFAARVLARAGRSWVGFFGRRRRPQVVMDIQDLWPDFGLLAGLLHEGRALDAMHQVEARAYAAADRLVVPTDSYRDAILAKGVDPAKVEVIPNWIPDRDAVVPDPAEVAAVRVAEGWGDSFVVLFAGNLGTAQGLETVVEAAARCDDPTVRWAFAGDGVERAGLEAEVARLGLTDRVQFLGRREPATMPALAGAADVLLVHLRPSPLADVVVPTKVNGYLAYGRPILCALGGEGAALVEQAKAGVVVAPGDPAAMVEGVQRLRNLPAAERTAMGERGRRHAEQELVRSVLLARYEQALGLRDAEPTPRSASTGGERRAQVVEKSTARTAPWGRSVAGPRFDGQRVLVTGATGGIGPSVVAAFQRAGASVRVLVRDPARAPGATEIVVGDITEPDTLPAAVAGCQIVVHLAGVAHQRGAGTEHLHRAVTHRGAVNVFAAAEAAGCDRVVFASTIAVYGPGGAFDEASPVRPVTPYAEAKVAAEADLAARVRRSGKPLGTILRLAAVYGTGRPDSVGQMFGALRSGRFVQVGAGDNRKSVVHVDDVAAAVVASAAAAHAAGQTFDVSDGHPRSMRQIIGLMCDALDRRPPPSVPVAPLRLTLDVASRVPGPIGRKTPDQTVVDALVSDVAVRADRITVELDLPPRVDLPTGIASLLAEKAGPGGLDRVLVFHIGSLGDTVLSVPALQALRRHLGPEATVTLLHNEAENVRVAPAAVIPPGLVDDVIPFPSDGRRPVDMARLARRLRQGRYDAVVNLALNDRAYRSLQRDRAFYRAAGITRFAGFGPEAPGVPEAEARLARLAELGIVADLGDGPWMEPPPDASDAADAWLGANLPGVDDLVTFAPGTLMSAKRWPTERWGEIGRRLLERYGLPSVVVGGPVDRDEGDALVTAWGGGANAAGALEPLGSAALLARARLHIGTDTGVTHMAAAAGTPVVALYSHRAPIVQWAPVGAGHRIVHHPVPCAGCRAVDCPVAGHPCMTQISVEDVWTQVVEALREHVPSAVARTDRREPGHVRGS